MARRVRAFALLIGFLAMSGFVGCSAPPTEFPVSGKVTVDGKPLVEGLIYFKTIETGAIETLNIANGEFKGLAKEGNRRIEIYAFRTTTQNFSGMISEVKENLIPAQYNMESKLTAAVTADGPNTFTFDLVKK